MSYSFAAAPHENDYDAVDESLVKRLVAVSYTHLDVYKRQAIEAGAISISSTNQNTWFI